MSMRPGESPDIPPGTADDAPSAEAQAPETPEELMRAASERIAALEAERDDFRDRWMRSEAEMANLRARVRREVDETRQYAVQKFATDVVETAENLRRALTSLPPPSPAEPETVTRLREGLEGMERSFVGMLERNGIARIDPTGEKFDPNLHQAMAEQPSTEYPAGTVLQSWTSGWTLNGRLLRPAMVVVSSGPADAAGPDGGARLNTTA